VLHELSPELIARCLAKGSLRLDWLHCRADGAPLPVEVTMTVDEEVYEGLNKRIGPRKISGFIQEQGGLARVRGL